MKVEWSTSTNNPAFRIYRVVEAPAGFSLVLSRDALEQLIIFDGDETSTNALHHDTQVKLQKLTEAGRRLARSLVPLQLRGIYIALDQIQLVARESRAWTNGLHRDVADAIRVGFLQTIDTEEISWDEMMREE